MTFYRLERTGAPGTAEGEVFTPLPDATSRWTGSHIRGPAVTSQLARAIERTVSEQAAHGGARLLPARSTFDLHSAAPMEPCAVRTRVLKRGRTLWVVEADLIAATLPAEEPERVMARCRTALVVPAVTDAGGTGAERAEAPDSVWAAPLPAECTPPAPELRKLSPTGRLYRSSSTGWSGSRAGHQNADRNVFWYYDDPIIEGEDPTPYQLAARAADLGNYVINYGAEGLSHINVDVDLSLARLPVPGGVGVASDRRVAHAGVSVGSAILFDTEGACGTSTITAVTHTKRRLAHG